MRNKAQLNLDRETTNVSGLLSGSVCKYELSTGKHVLTEKRLLEKTALINRFEYSPLGTGFKKQTQFARKTIFTQVWF